MKAVLIFLVTTLLPVHADWSTFETVWEKSKEEAHSFEGVIKVIYVDDEEDRIMVRMKSEDQVDLEEFMVCPNGIQSALNQNESTEMRLIRQAFANGTTVKVGYEGPFQRCISSIKLISESRQQVGI